MNQPSSQFVKKTILKLLRAIGSEKEIKKYIQRFSSAEQHFAVIKVGGSVVKDDLENLITSLIFLDQVGLKPVILHGAGPMLTEELESRAIDFSFIDGQRVTSNEVMNVAQRVFTETNKRIVDKLQDQGAKAIGITQSVFECTLGDPKLGLVGKINKVNISDINSAIDKDMIPVIAPLGYESSKTLNINADLATIELVKAIKPYKVVFLSETGGIFNNENRLIETINLALEYDELMQEDWLHSGMRLKLKQIKTLLDFLPKSSSVSITQPINLPKELFTDSGSGTMVKHGFRIKNYKAADSAIKVDFKNIIEASFNKKLIPDFFDQNSKLNIFMSSCNRATIAISEDFLIPYMDKFGVLPDAKGEGLGAGLWSEMRKVYPKLFWRSRRNNSINSFYSSICDGCQKHSEWNVYWIGIEDYSLLKNCIEYAISKPKSVI